MAHLLYEKRLQGIMVVLSIILDWKFALMNTATVKLRT